MTVTLALLADEDFNHDVIRGAVRRHPSIDIVCAQDVGLRGSEDSVVLEWAASHNRVLLTHDVNTLLTLAYERSVNGLHMPGVFAVSQSAPIGAVIDSVLLLVECSLPGEWEGQIRYLPL